ncbi:hypothetical protein MBLNU459_g5243t2 [Dothideomycetes sp. NU459]
MPRSEIDANHEMLAQYVDLMLRYFKTCQDLAEWYAGEGNVGPYAVEGTGASLESKSKSEEDGKTEKSISQSEKVPRANKLAKHGRKSVSPLIKALFGRKAKAGPEPSSSSSASTSAPESSPNSSATQAGARTTIGLRSVSQAINPSTASQSSGLSTSIQTPAETKTSFRKKICWARHDYDTFLDMIRRLQAGNENLEQLVKRISRKHGPSGLPTYEEAHRLWPQVDEIRYRLGKLHGDLQDINPAADQETRFHLSVQLLEDHSKSRDPLERQRGLKRLLRHRSNVFNIQRHCSADLDDSPELLAIECADDPVPETPIRFRVMTDLSRPSEEAMPNIQNVEIWGRVVSSDVDGTEHAVYHQHGTQWLPPTTLEDLLRGTEYHDKISPIQTVQLARLVLAGFLYLEDVRPPTTDPTSRPSNYLFYRTAQDNDDGWDSDSPLVLQPWVSLGFGLQPPPVAFGKTAGVGSAANATMSELGLLLHQIGVGRLLSYGGPGGGGGGLWAARTAARGDVSELERRVGWIYAKVVEGLLEFEAAPRYLLAADSPRGETEHVKRGLEALLRLEQGLQDAPTATAALPQIQSPAPDPITPISAAVASSEQELGQQARPEGRISTVPSRDSRCVSNESRADSTTSTLQEPVVVEPDSPTPGPGRGDSSVADAKGPRVATMGSLEDDVQEYAERVPVLAS